MVWRLPGKCSKRLPGIKVIILSAHNDDAYVESAAKCGAVGFLLKQSSASDLCHAIREVQMGKSFFGAFYSKRLDHHKSHRGTRTGPIKMEVAELTSRELEVLQLVAEGKTNKETAAELGISIKTVEKHREHLSAKLDIHDIAGLTRYAIAAGVIESSVQLTIV